MDARVDRVGLLETPVVTIDGAVADPEYWRSVALESDWAPRGDYYPGPRAEAPQAYLHALAGPLRLALGQVYGWRSQIEVLRCYFSLATTPASQLSLAQRAPHTDSYDPTHVAFVHFLCPARFGGTAFYRQCSTGFERIDAANCAAFEAARAAEIEREAGSPPQYVSAQSPLFEQLHACSAGWNRIVFFPSNLLHCADLAGVTLDPDPASGRLTVAGFLRPGS